jgi:hypothetical protein
MCSGENVRFLTARCSQMPIWSFVQDRDHAEPISSLDRDVLRIAVYRGL